MNNINLELQLKYKYLIEIFKSSTKSLFHLKSVGNFINDIEKIKDNSEQLRVAGLLMEYLKFIDSNPIIDRKGSNELYFKYIAPIASVYQYQLNYKIYIGYVTIFIWILFVNGFLILVNINEIIWIYVIPNTFFIIYYLRSLYFTFKKKVYSIRY